MEGSVLLDEALVDAHLVGVPGLGTLTARRLAGGDLEVLGGQADGALDAEVLVLGAVDELLADLLERLDLARGQGDADLVDLGTLGKVLLLVVRHFWRFCRRQAVSGLRLTTDAARCGCWHARD